MKKILLLTAMIWASQLNAQLQKADLLASGLTCAMCSKAVHKSLSAISFVDTILVDIQKSTYSIRFKEGLEVDYDVLSRAVVDAGFSVARFTVTTRLNNVNVSKDGIAIIDGKRMHFDNPSVQTLNGEKTIRLIDKNFVSQKEYKKYVQNGVLAAGATGIIDGQRVYQVTL